MQTAPPDRGVAFESQLGPIRLIRKIGRGAMGEVWLGRHKLLGRDVAVKFLMGKVADENDPAFAQFIAGAQAAAGVVHAGLNQIHHADVAAGVPYLVLELLDGRNLDEVLQQAHPIGLEAARAVIEAICEAVAELHHRDLVHRDLKPSNFVLTTDGRVVVTDYGLACARVATALGTDSGSVAGTPPYMAPEMFDGIVSARTDVYALGISAYQLLCGQLAFRGTLDELKQQHRTAAIDVRPLCESAVPDGVIDVIVRATSKDALFRPKSARHLLDAFRVAFDAAQIKCASRIQLAALLKKCDSSVQPTRAKIAATNDSFPQVLATIAMRRRELRRRSESPDPVTDPSHRRIDPAQRKRRKVEHHRQKIVAWIASIVGTLISYVVLSFISNHSHEWELWFTGVLNRIHAFAPPQSQGSASAPVLRNWALGIILAMQGVIVTFIGYSVSLWLYTRLRGPRLPDADGKTKCGWCQHELRGISVPLCSECGHQIGHRGPDEEGDLPVALRRGHGLRVFIFIYTLFLTLSLVFAVLGGVISSLIGHHGNALLGGPFFTLMVILLALRATIGAHEMGAQVDLVQSGRSWCRKCSAELRDLVEPNCPACGERI